MDKTAKRGQNREIASGYRTARGSVRIVATMIIGYHIIISGYGTWLSNDLRGSGSEQTRKPELDALGPVHKGRKPVQPRREELRGFFREAEPLLDFPVLWFDQSQRDAIGEGIGRAVAVNNYTMWACAVCRNHMHFCVRRHRDDDVSIRDAIANGARELLLERGLIAPDHPVWSSRKYAVYLNTSRDVVSRVDYTSKNPEKEGLAPQHWDFVKPYDGWPGRRWNLKP